MLNASVLDIEVQRGQKDEIATKFDQLLGMSDYLDFVTVKVYSEVEVQIECQSCKLEGQSSN